MEYKSTRNNQIKYSSKEVIAKGISDEGGLFVPNEFPQITANDIQNFKGQSYNQRAEFILKKFLTDFTDDEINYCVDMAYGKSKFTNNIPAPIVKLENDKAKAYILELWHGPTCAFKDMALQILPLLITASTRKKYPNKETVVLVATSGDTGKAALEGFKDVKNTRIIVFYPELGVSDMQKRQMITQEGKNVSVCAIKGNFDDAQTAVKHIFTDKDVIKTLDENNMMFSSANSINWGRLLPQIVYYFSAYCDIMKNNKDNEEINICVPTGNFGNILAAYYARKMGLPIKKLICASNSNDVLTEFINTGVYSKIREFKSTISPSMDILISSNLERLLYELYEEDDSKVRDLMRNLSQIGKYEISRPVLLKMQNLFLGYSCNDKETKETIKNIFDEYSYLVDTHTAVAINAYKKYKKQTNDSTKTLIVSTANAYKFAADVLDAISCRQEQTTNKSIEKLASISNVSVPEKIQEIKNKKIRFTKSIEVNEVRNFVLETLAINKEGII